MRIPGGPCNRALKRTAAPAALLAALALAGSPEAATQYIYDSQGRLIAVVYDNGERITYNYDDAGNRETVVTTATAGNLPPTANTSPVTLTVDEGDGPEPVSSPLTKFTDPNGGVLEIAAATQGGHGAVAFTASTLTYDVGAGVSGPSQDGFVYSVRDPLGAYGTVPVAVTIANVAPTANDDSFSVPTSHLITYDPRTNDTDPGGDPLFITGVTQPSHGTAAFSPTAVSYQSAVGYSGPDSFTYTISDGDGGSDTATINVTVTAPNHPPIANPDAIEVPKNGSRTFDPRTNDTDANGNPLIIIGKTDGANGTVTFTAATLTYTPAANFTGQDGFTYTISDGAGGTDVGTVLATVVNNQPPVAVNDSRTVVINSASTFDPRVNDSDPEGGALTIVGVGTPSHGGVVINSGVSVTYTPATGYTGPDSFGYTIQDPPGATASATVNITVTSSNTPPTAVDDELEVTGLMNQIIFNSVNVLVNDTDPEGQSLSVIGFTNGTKGTVTNLGGGVLRYTTNSGNSFGADSFTYTISDGSGGTDVGTVNVTIVREGCQNC